MSPDQDEGFRVTDRRGRESRAPIGGQTAEGTSGIGARAGTERPATPHRDLRGLFMTVATEAVIALGDAPDPASAQVRPDLAAAAQVIDLLVLLRQKTEGNRSPEESEVLGDLIYDLQMRYVRATKSRAS